MRSRIVLFRLLLLFTIVPLLEIWLLVEIGRATSTLFTVLLVLGTGFAGAGLARYQGVQTFARMQKQLASGKPPTGELLDGILILLAGAVLITPGVLTDLFGFALLTPVVRGVLKSRMIAWFKARTSVQFHSVGTPVDANTVQSQVTEVIDAEFTREIIDDEPDEQ